MSSKTPDIAFQGEFNDAEMQTRQKAIRYFQNSKQMNSPQFFSKDILQ